MQTAQTIIKDYRRKRVIVCVTVALVTLVLTLGIRFISQRNINQDRIDDFTHHTVRALDKVLLSLEAQRETLLSLVGIPCSEANLIPAKTGGAPPDRTLHRPHSRRNTLLLKRLWQP